MKVKVNDILVQHSNDTGKENALRNFLRSTASSPFDPNIFF
jgi:hypothetical protein